MVQHIFKIIWTERKVNFWILIELILIFCILWFCTDYLTFMLRRYLLPVGFNIENTYMIEFALDEEKVNKLIEETGKDKDETAAEYGWIIFNRIKQNPDIQHVSVSVNTYPYNSGMNMNTVLINNDTIPVEGDVYYREVSPEYFDVFKIKFESGKAFTWDDYGKKILLINGDDRNEIGGYSINEVNTIRFFYRDDPDETYQIGGVIERSKRDPFNPYKNETYTLFEKSNMAFLGTSGADICVRIKDHVDEDTFVEKFTNDMYDQVNIGPYYLSKVTPFRNIEKQYMFWMDYSGNFKSILAITSFLLINIFGGLIGTFWFRTRERRNEIGLRMATGSTRLGIKQIFIGETLLLVGIACIIGTIISLNISITDTLRNIGVPVANRQESLDVIQYLLNFGITFLILAVTSTLAVWYPANEASKIQPAIALREE